MKEIIVYEMVFKGEIKGRENIICVPFQEKYWKDYMEIYNVCFSRMRDALEIQPVFFYSDYSKFKDKADNTFVCLQGGDIAGAVSCYGNELDDLVVNPLFQRKGYGRQLLLWGMNCIKERGYDEIVLHVAEWNQNAVKLYLETGFEIMKKEKVR